MKNEKNIKMAFLLNLGFSLFEIIGGLLTNSVAILSDSIHDFGDSIAIGISYLLERFSNQSPNKQYTYGYKRYSVLGAFFTSGILIIGSLIVIFEALSRIVNPVAVSTTGMFIFAIIGIIVNGIAAYKTSKSINLNEQSVNLHMLEDVLGWLAVLVGTLIIKITGWNIIDPLLSLVIALIIGYKAVKNLLEIIQIIAEKIPKNIDIDKISEDIKKINQVIDVHHIHVWTIDGVDTLLTMHVQVKQNTTKNTYEELKNEIKKHLKKLGIKHSTIEIEYIACQDKDCKA